MVDEGLSVSNIVGGDDGGEEELILFDFVALIGDGSSSAQSASDICCHASDRKSVV